MTGHSQDKTDIITADTLPDSSHSEAQAATNIAPAVDAAQVTVPGLANLNDGTDNAATPGDGSNAVHPVTPQEILPNGAAAAGSADSTGSALAGDSTQ
ncbi:hypothetical protein BGZ83_002421 [Gryganskiella cystojenkinii]|nr:hypothetical protein BGZ83_002421 [Gryganskiella cystojenkinii]